MDAKNSEIQGIEQNNNNDDDDQNYGKLLAIIAIVVVVGFVFLAAFSGVVTFAGNLLDSNKNQPVNKVIINQLRDVASEINSRTPIRINDDTIITSVAVSESATVIFRGLSPNLTASDVKRDNVLNGIKNTAHGMACSNEVIFRKGASMRFVFSTIDGYEIDSGVINSVSCK